MRYVGPLASVEIAATQQTAERGKVVEVPDVVGRDLVKQSTWKKVTAKKKENPDG